ncbi:MAG: putative phage abortive infection protein [Nitrospirota bacterium]
MGHYLENLYEILRFVDSRLENEQRFFANLLRAQLSSNEIILLFYMTVTDRDDGGRFYPLIKKFRILEHNIPMGRLASPQDVEIHSDLLQASAES